MEKLKDKIVNAKIEVLFMIVLLALVIISGIAIFSVITKNKNIENFKDDATSILSVSKNIYTTFEKTNKYEYITTSNDGTAKAVCITIDGLDKNDYLTKDYSDWDGYVVIEKENNTYSYALWATNGKYVVDGVLLEDISELTLQKGITKYNDEKFSDNVKKSFESKDNKYSKACINEKVE